MSDEAQDVERLRSVLPAAVRAVCERLDGAGFEAYAVGGAVRDALLGRTPGDWDVATSAHPDEVVGLFERTIPTGIDHGTVTVMWGRGRGRMGIEVTTFRGEGAYSDARRPDEVRFGVPLREDLARRDFVINAIAFDPVGGRLADPFDGRGDLRRRIVRAVGVPLERFTEDGLRVMRAMRFAAVLGFALDEATEAAITGALPSLAKVSAERVQVELYKTLGAPRPSVGLDIGRRTGILEVILPEVTADRPAPAQERAWRAITGRIDRAEDVVVRLAALLVEVAPAAADAALRRLKCKNADRELAVALIRWHAEWPTWEHAPAHELRAALGQLGRERIGALRELVAAGPEAPGRDAVLARVDEIVAAGDALTVRELAIGGADVMAASGRGPGRHVGEILSALLARVQREPALNEPDTLRQLAAELARDD